MKDVHLFRTMIAAAVAMILVVSGAAAQGDQPPEGKIEVIGGTTYDWGTVEPGKLKAEIQIKNTGTGTLNIKEVRPSCGCTASEIDKKVLGPGELGKVSVTLNANTNGAISKYLNITSDDPNTPLVTVTLKANIKKPFHFTPSDFFSVLNGKVGVEQTVSINMVNIGDEEFTLHPPQFVSGNVKVRFEQTEDKVLKPGDATEIKMYVTPLKAGPIGGAVDILTSIASTKRLDITGTDVVENTAPH